MRIDPHWSKPLLVMGSIAFLLGVVDPLEGSVVILAGSVATTAGVWIRGAERRRKAHWAATTAAVAFGVMWLFILSYLGGFGGNSKLSMWWGLLIVPYPLGWISGLWAIIHELKRWSESDTAASH